MGVAERRAKGDFARLLRRIADETVLAGLPELAVRDVSPAEFERTYNPKRP